MAAKDRLTALQTNLDELSEQFYVAIGVLQRDAASVPIPDFPLQADVAAGAQAQNEKLRESLRDMTTNMVRLSRDLDTFIDVLRGVNTSEAQQMEEIARLEQQNQEAQQGYVAALGQAEQLLGHIRSAIHTISESQ